MGGRSALVTMSLDTIGRMSCNPAVGGVGKTHLVREVDAMGGEIAKAADRAGIQFRTLNTRKGPAVRAVRVQTDRRAYETIMRVALMRQRGLDVIQGTVRHVAVRGGAVCGVRTQEGFFVKARAVVLAPGTFLNGTLHLGLRCWPGGRTGEPPSTHLSTSLRRLGLPLKRLKTGTPPRLDGRTVDFSQLEEQPGAEPPPVLSARTRRSPARQRSCYVTWTTPQTHQLIARSLDRSPVYAGRIRGTGPRYCPSIETKVVAFSQRDRHQLFLEPEGLTTHEIYVNGLATSLPEDVQTEIVRTVPGLEHARITRYGYAVEYDFVPPTSLQRTLQVRTVPGLFLAGQINGTSGYEEAAAQGLLAGANALLWVRGMEPIVLQRWESYAGVLVDDLVTKGTEEPYRIFTSQAEYRLVLRPDNAEERLLPVALKAGLVPASRRRSLDRWLAAKQVLLDQLERRGVEPGEINDYLSSIGSSPITGRTRLIDIARRPGVTLIDLVELGFTDRQARALVTSVEADIKYAGYQKRQAAHVERLRHLERRRIPPNADFSRMGGLSAEAREKLSMRRPHTVGQASRIPGVTPADLSVLMIHIAGGL
jgi:tRNA uridine 5-carboxymethylaminomethyl modification enzyme